MFLHNKARGYDARPSKRKTWFPHVVEIYEKLALKAHEKSHEFTAEGEHMLFGKGRDISKGLTNHNRANLTNQSRLGTRL